MNIKRYLEKEKIYSIHEADFIDYLTSLGILENIINGEYRCKICSEKLTLENIGALIPINKQIVIVCDKLLCVNDVIEEGKSE